MWGDTVSMIDAGQARAVDDLPRLALDRAQMRVWTEDLTQIVGLLASWREHRNRVAEDAARRHDEDEKAARTPTVRPLTESETREWRGGAADGADTDTRFDVYRGRGLRVRVGPVESGRWVLDAQVDQVSTAESDPQTGPAGPQTLERVEVSCATEREARKLADALAAAGPDPQTLRTLRERVAQRAARQAAAAGRVRETDPQLRDRVRDEVRRHWSPELAERVISSPAFGRFAAGLGALESHGATIEDVLRRQGLQDKLSRPLVRDPAAFGASMFASLLTTIDGEVVPDQDTARTTAQQRRRPSPTPRGGGQAQAPGAPGGGSSPEERAWLRSITEETVWPALRTALGEPVARQVRAAGGYERLAQELAARHAVGWSLDALLTGLPAGRIITADDPAGYLRGIIGRRVEQRGPDPRDTRRPSERPRVDQHAMARMVSEVFPEATARRLLDCPAWPALCAQMARAQSIGEVPPVAELLAQLPDRAIGKARKPAAYAAELLRRELAVRRGTDPVAETAAEDARLGRGPDAAARLDPARPLDRVGLDDLDPAADAEAAAHQHAAGQYTARADDEDRDAAAERAADPGIDPAPETAPGVTPGADVDSTAPVNGVDLDAAAGVDPGHARVDDNLAAADRARAAEERGSAAAAALRAQVVHTPHDTSQTTQAARPVGKATPVPSAAKTALTRARRR